MISNQFRDLYQSISESERNSFQSTLNEMIRQAIREELGREAIIEAPAMNDMVTKFEAFTHEFLTDLFGESGDADYDREVITNHFEGGNVGGNLRKLNDAFLSAFSVFKEDIKDFEPSLETVSEDDFFLFLLDGSVGDVDHLFKVLEVKMSVGADGKNLFSVFKTFTNSLYDKLYDLNMKS